jgi:hypothetical protein
MEAIRPINAAVQSPALWGIPVATLALLIALLSLAASIAAIGWQIYKHWLDGGLVRVYMNPICWDPVGGSYITNTTGRWQFSPGSRHRADPTHIELAQLIIENPGRTAVTLHSPGLSLENSRHSHHVVCPTLISGELLPGAESNASPRVEPYGRVVFFFNYWQIVHGFAKESSGDLLEIRGAISVAGKTKISKSPKGVAWRIPREAVTIHGNHFLIDPTVVMWRTAYWAFREKVPPFLLAEIIRHAMDCSEERPTWEKFSSDLTDSALRFDVDDFPGKRAARLLLGELDRYEGKLLPWNASQPPERDSTNPGTG